MSAPSLDEANRPAFRFGSRDDALNFLCHSFKRSDNGPTGNPLNFAER